MWMRRRLRKPLSLANACYRIGDFDNAIALADRILAVAVKASGDALAAHELRREHALHVKGLVAYEKGDVTEAEKLLSKASVHGWYLRALIAHARGEDKAAIELCRAMLAQRPSAVRPALLLAWLMHKADADGATKLARQQVEANPASIDALEVLARIATDPAETATATTSRDQLLAGNPDADRYLGLLRQELDKGVWVYPARYGKPLPRAERQ